MHLRATAQARRNPTLNMNMAYTVSGITPNCSNAMSTSAMVTSRKFCTMARVTESMASRVWEAECEGHNVSC